jgi:hypothetical protein
MTPAGCSRARRSLNTLWGTDTKQSPMLWTSTSATCVRSCTLMVGSRDSSPHGDWTRLSVSAFGPNRLMRPWLGMETVRLAVPRAALSPEADAIWPLARLAPFSADTTPSDPARSC